MHEPSFALANDYLHQRVPYPIRMFAIVACRLRLLAPEFLERRIEGKKWALPSRFACGRNK